MLHVYHATSRKAATRNHARAADAANITGGEPWWVSDGAVDRLGFIRRARELGFEVYVIRELLNLSGQPQKSCAKVDALAGGT